MYGRVRCARHGCGRERKVNDFSCPICGNVSAYVDIKHKGTRYRISRDHRGHILRDIQQAHDLLGEIRLQYNKDRERFNPKEYLLQAIKQRKLSYQADQWLAQKRGECEAGEMSWETYKGYRTYVRHYFTPLDDMAVGEIDYAVLERFKDGLPKARKIKTRRNILNALHSCLKWMHRRGVIREFPAWPVIEGDDSESRSAIDYTQQIEGLSRIPIREDRECIEFGFEMLLRPGELCALKVKDIDQLHRRMIVRRTWSGSRLRETTKGKNKIWLPLTFRGWEIITPRLRNRESEDFIFINHARGRGRYASSTGRPYRPKVLNNIWNTCSGYDLDHYSAGRHSGCTQLIHDGTPHLEAQALMRHADIRSTLNYFHADSDRLRHRLDNRGRANTLQTLLHRKKGQKKQ